MAIAKNMVGYFMSVSGGHNYMNERNCGVVRDTPYGLMDESRENRNMRKLLAHRMRKRGIKIYNNTIDHDPEMYIKKNIQKCNSRYAHLNVMFHFSHMNDHLPIGEWDNGFMIVTNEWNPLIGAIGKYVCENMAEIGFANRGILIDKTDPFLNKTRDNAIIIKPCFLDNDEDVKLYKRKKNEISMALDKGIVRGFREVIGLERIKAEERKAKRREREFDEQNN